VRALTFSRMPLMNRYRAPIVRFVLAATLAGAAACDSSKVTSSATGTKLVLNPCSTSGTLTLAPATAARIDCSAGGTTLTLAGNGASYLIVPQFPTDQAANQFVDYQLFTGNVAAASASMSRLASARLSGRAAGGAAGAPPEGPPHTGRRAAEKALRARSALRSRT